jgi:hypothetical protein
VDVTESRYQVGQRLHHPQFGDGLIVEVHTDRGREVLEVVFDGELRRLSAMREWEIVDGSAPHTPASGGPNSDDLDGGDDEPALITRPLPTSRRHWHPQGDGLLKAWIENASQPQSHFDLRADAEAWAGWASADRLV